MAKKPQIRFKGHQEEWQEKKFAELAKTRRGLTYSPKDIVADGDGVKVLRSSNIKGDRFSQNEDDVFVDGSCINIPFVHDGDILITSANGSTNLVGKHAIIKGLKSPTVHGGFMLLAESDQPEFTNAIMSSGAYSKFIKLFVAGGNGAIGNLNKKDLDELTFNCPINEEELNAIGVFFAHIDSIISLRERELEKLKQLKAACLDKMFANGGGKSRPSIRFAGFTDEWHTRRLVDCLTISTTTNIDGIYGKEDVLSVSGEYGVVNQIAFQGRSFAGASVSNYRVIKDGNLVYTKSPLKANPYGIIKTAHGIEGIVSPLYAVYDAKENTDSTFVEQYFDTDAILNNYLRPLVNKGAKNTLLISDEGALQGEISMPAIAEQRKISQYIALINNVLYLRQKEIGRLQNIKQACLKQMFA